MVADALKGNGITNLDGSSGVITTNSPDAYGPGLTNVVADFVTPTTGGLADTTSTYKMVRLPSAVCLRELVLRAAARLDTGGASAAFLVDVGAYYSDSKTDGTVVANQGTSISANCFLAAHSFATTLDSVASGVAKPGDLIIDAMQGVNANLIGSPLWKQVGLTSDPGGFIDVVVAVHTAANTAAATPFAVEAWFTR